MNDWEVADRISDRIVNALNEERDRMVKAGTIEPFQLLAGVLLALTTLLSEAPLEQGPNDLISLKHCAAKVLSSLMEWRRRENARRKASRN
jgi:hypothetical protein